MNATQRRAAQLLDDLRFDMKTAKADIDGVPTLLWPMVRDHIINLEERNLHSALVLGRLEREILMYLESVAELELPDPRQREILEEKARWEERQMEERESLY